MIPLLAALAVNAYAHAGEPPEPHDLWGAWSLDPGVVVPLALTAILFAAGAKKSRGVSATQAACFWLGWLVLAVALISPLHRLGEALFSAHMAQHEFLMLLAAPLLVLSRPLIPILWGLPIRWRRALGQWSKRPLVTRSWLATTRPAVAWCVHAAALWLWHAPRLFQATLSSDWIHSAQHISFLGSALLFWWSLFYAQWPHRLWIERFVYFHHRGSHQHSRSPAHVCRCGLVSGLRPDDGDLGAFASGRSTDRRSDHVDSGGRGLFGERDCGCWRCGCAKAMCVANRRRYAQ